MKLTINKKKYKIKPVSELTFNEYNKVIIQAEAVTLPEYLSVMTGISPDDLLNAKLSNASIPALSLQLLNIQDHNQVIKEKKNVFEFDGEIITLNQIEYDTFGKSYFFELVNQNEKLNDFQKCVYSLAIGLNKTHNMEDVTKIYDKLCELNWMKVLPQSFFLHKKLMKKKISSILLSMNCTFKLKKIKRKILISLRNYAKLEKI